VLQHRGVPLEAIHPKLYAFFFVGYCLVHDYWVSGKDFYMMRIHYFHNFTNRHLIELFGTITDLEEAEQKAVLKAIKQWEDSMLSDSQVEKLSEVLEQHRQQHESVYLLLIDRKAFGLTPEL
jgi:hypothetical protein